MLELSLREARRIAVGAQLLTGPLPRRATKSTILDTIRHIGALQIDSISVVARSHHIVLWSRIGNHQQEWLYELLGKDRAIFEYWAHAAAYVPIELFPYFRRIMLEHADPEYVWGTWSSDWFRENEGLLDRVVAHIRENGAVSTKSFDPPEGAGRAAAWAWYGNKPTNRALDYLWTMGTLMIDRRDKFMRWYDLTERVHPTWDDGNVPSIEEERRVLGDIAVRAMGLCSPRWLPDYFRTGGTRQIPSKHAREVLDGIVERGLGVRAKVEGLSEEFVVWSDYLERKIPPSRTTLLSPFDNLIWHRQRTSDLFGMELRLESYTPADKRIYGYFSLPILYRDQLVGRIDPKADRKERVLSAKAVHLEPWFVKKADDRFFAALAATMRDFATFNGCDEIVVERGDPEPAAAGLRSALHGSATVVEI